MEVKKSGSISQKEVDALVKEYLEKKLGTKVTALHSRTRVQYSDGDWRGECPDWVFDGYGFEAEHGS